jgi:hypothetical protein
MFVGLTFFAPADSEMHGSVLKWNLFREQLNVVSGGIVYTRLCDDAKLCA